jgi:serine phosphatase RsbU (regulator of sigma subunit)
MSVRFRSVRSRGAAAALAAAWTLTLFASLGGTLDPDPVAAAGISVPIPLGEGSSPVQLPPVKITVPSPSGDAPLAEVGVGEKGVSVATPTPPPLPKAEVPPTPTVPSVPPLPPAEKIADPTGSVPALPVGVASGGSAGSGSSGQPGAQARSASAGAQAGGKALTRSGRASIKGVASAGKGGGSGAEGTHGAGPGGAPGGAVGAAAGRNGPKGSGKATGLPAAHRESTDPLSSFGRELPIPLPVPDWSKPIILLLALLAIAFAVRWRLASRRAGSLERRQDALLADIKVMQEALAPEVPETLQGLGLSIAYRPAEGPAAGGDFYDVFELGSERVAVILGDVAGHGHDAVRQAAVTRFTLRAFLKQTADPRTALAHAGHALSDPGYGQMATVAMALFDSASGTLTYALAGHPPPLLIGLPAGDVPASCSAPPVGCELPTGSRQRTVSLPAGGRACFFSDGLIEARLSDAPVEGHADLLGRDRLAELFCGLPAEAGADELLAAVRAEAAATPDDMAACILTPHVGTAGRVIDVEELEVGRRALDDGHLDAYLGASGLGAGEKARVLAEVDARLETEAGALLLVDRSGGDEIEVSVRGCGERRAPSVPPSGPPSLLRA